MRYSFGLSVVAVILTACAGDPPDKSGDGYFDHITPDPAALERKTQEDRLVKAENQPQTVRPPVEATQQSGTAVSTDISRSGSAKRKVVTEGDGTISQSQDFKVVKSRETIASDAAKREALKSNYKVVQPGTAPTRGSGINLAKYALTQSNPVGNKVYKRLPLGGRKAQKNCAIYISSDEAQIAFLKNGGPQRDRRGIDPDGDGYACRWSPAVYRSLIGQ